MTGALTTSVGNGSSNSMQSDWSEILETNASFIKNKPAITTGLTGLTTVTGAFKSASSKVSIYESSEYNMPPFGLKFDMGNPSVARSFDFDGDYLVQSSGTTVESDSGAASRMFNKFLPKSWFNTSYVRNIWTCPNLYANGVPTRPEFDSLRLFVSQGTNAVITRAVPGEYIIVRFPTSVKVTSYSFTNVNTDITSGIPYGFKHALLAYNGPISINSTSLRFDTILDESTALNKTWWSSFPVSSLKQGNYNTYALVVTNIEVQDKPPQLCQFNFVCESTEASGRIKIDDVIISTFEIKNLLSTLLKQ